MLLLLVGRILISKMAMLYGAFSKPIIKYYFFKSSYFLCYFRAQGVFPVYNYVSSPANSASWKTYNQYGIMIKDFFSIQQSVWYYSVFFTTSSTLHEISHFFLHRIPGIFLDKIAVWNGQKPRYTVNHFPNYD